MLLKIGAHIRRQIGKERAFRRVRAQLLLRLGALNVLHLVLDRQVDLGNADQPPVRDGHVVRVRGAVRARRLGLQKGGQRVELLELCLLGGGMSDAGRI